MERLLSAVLKGEPTQWTFAAGAGDDAFLAAVSRHAVQALIAYRVRAGVLFDVPAPVVQALSGSAVQQAAVEEVFAAELRRVLAALAADGVPALLMKGAALAYTHYPDPSLRPRTDTDLMLRRQDVEGAGRVLERLGYAAFNLITGSLVMDQCTWTKTDPLGLRHVYDLHWKIVNPRLVSDLLTWEELDRHAVTLSSPSPAARVFCNAHALLLACVHRVAHHFNDERLLWLYDIHLVAGSLDGEGWDTFVRVVTDPAAAAMCRRSLSAAALLFGTAVPARVAKILGARADEVSLEPFAMGTRRIDVVLSDLEALPTWRGRARLLKEHLFPPAEFMKRQYGIAHPLLVPTLYVRRWVTGARRWFRPIVP